MKDILIIAHYTQAPGEAGNNRFSYIANKLCEEQVNIEVVTSSFSHNTKCQRKITEHQLSDVSYKFTMIYEPDYKKNVSLKRFYSHYVFGKNLKSYLEKRKRPDVIYCAVPSLDAAKAAAEYAKKENIRFIIDIQDLWPEAFKMVFNIPIISNIIYFPLEKKAKKIYSLANEIVAVSNTYLETIINENKRSNPDNAVYLGTDLEFFDKLVEENKYINKPQNEIWIVYIGTLGHSYDLYSVIDALKILKDNGRRDLRFIVMGDGPLESKFQSYAKKQNINYKFTGRLEYHKMVGILKECDVAVNPIKSGSAGSIINKVADYAAAALPVINTQECEEYRKLLIDYECGLNCRPNDISSIVDNLTILIDDENLRKVYAANSRKLAEEKFDRAVTYKKILTLL